MSVEHLQRIIERERAVQRRARFYLAGLAVAVGIILATLVVSI